MKEFIYILMYKPVPVTTRMCKYFTLYMRTKQAGPCVQGRHFEMNISEEEVKKLPVKRHKMDTESEEDKSPLGKIKPTFQEQEDEESISQCGLPECGKIKDDNLTFIEV